MSSNSVGRTFFIASRMPSDSSWKTPVESPRGEHLEGGRVVHRDLGHVQLDPA